MGSSGEGREGEALAGGFVMSWCGSLGTNSPLSDIISWQWSPTTP